MCPKLARNFGWIVLTLYPVPPLIERISYIVKLSPPDTNNDNRCLQHNNALSHIIAQIELWNFSTIWINSLLLMGYIITSFSLKPSNMEISSWAISRAVTKITLTFRFIAFRLYAVVAHSPLAFLYCWSTSYSAKIQVKQTFVALLLHY